MKNEKRGQRKRQPKGEKEGTRKAGQGKSRQKGSKENQAQAKGKTPNSQENLAEGQTSSMREAASFTKYWQGRSVALKKPDHPGGGYARLLAGGKRCF